MSSGTLGKPMCGQKNAGSSLRPGLKFTEAPQSDLHVTSGGAGASFLVCGGEGGFLQSPLMPLGDGDGVGPFQGPTRPLVRGGAITGKLARTELQDLARKQYLRKHSKESYGNPLISPVPREPEVVFPWEMEQDQSASQMAPIPRRTFRPSDSRPVIAQRFYHDPSPGRCQTLGRATK